MTLPELLRFALKGLTGHGLRTALSLLGVSIGIASVLVLTALGDGAKQYVVGQFQSLGTNLLIVLPGKTETSGTFGIGGVPNDLTLEDAEAIERFVPQARRVVPVSMGTEEISFGGLSRQIAIVGATPDYLKARQLRMARRLALKRGLAPVSDFDAVRLLGRQGIDPFQRANMLELVQSDRGTHQSKAAIPVQLPKKIEAPQLPSTEVLAQDDRAREIVRMQRD